MRRGPSPARAQYLSDLPAAMARGLVRCQAIVVLVCADVRSGGVHRSTLLALERHGLIAQTRDTRQRLVWRPTAAGAALIAREEPRLLAVRGDYTTRSAEAVTGEPEAVDAATADRFARHAADRDVARRAGELDELLAEARSLEERLGALKRLAWERGVDARSDLRVIEARLDAIERKVRRVIREAA